MSLSRGEMLKGAGWVLAECVVGWMSRIATHISVSGCATRELYDMCELEVSGVYDHICSCLL